MSSKPEIYTFTGCILVAAVIMAIGGGCTKRQSPPSIASSPVKTVAETNTNAAPAEVPKALPETPLPDPYFRLTIKSETDIDESTDHQKIETDVELKYAHQKTNDGVILTFYSMELKKRQEGAFVQDILMTRDKLVTFEGNEKNESSFDELSQKWQAGIAGTFATGLCRITLDADRNEMGRQMLSPSGTGLIGEENLDLVRLMHGPFHRGTVRWQSTNTIPTTYAFVIHCPVASTRAGDTNDIKMEGSFTSDTIASPQDGAIFKNVSCSFAGLETFDEIAGEYISGEAAFEYKFQIFQGDVQVATLDRRVKLSLERITAKGR